MADIKVRSLEEDAPEVKITSETPQKEETQVEEKKRGNCRGNSTGATRRAGRGSES